MGLVAKAFQDIITFSRASSGTYVNSNGYITNSSVLNYLTYSNQPENAAWTKSNSFVQQNLAINSQDFDLWSLGAGVTVAANSTIAPDGTLTADRITFTAGGVAEFVRRTATLTVGVVYTVSVYAQAAVGTPTFVFDVGNGAATSTAQTPTSAWQRFTFTFTFSGANQWVDLEASAAGTIAFWGAQLVQGSVPGDYRATTSAALPCLYADYNGALRARKLCETSGNSTHSISQSITTTATPYTFSKYYKQPADGSARRYVLMYHSQSNAGWVFDLQTGTAGVGGTTGVNAPVSYAIVSVGGGWYRCQIVVNATAASNAFLTYLVDNNGSSGSVYTGDGSSGIYIADAQLNDGSSALAYYDTTASAYNAPRFDYDPVTLAAKGLLVEESRTNLLLQSNDFQTSWAPANITRTLNSTLSPSGNVDGVKIAATATATTALYQQANVAATSATFSVYAKQGTGATTANNFIIRNITTLTNLVAGTLNYSTGVFTYTVGSTGVVVTNAGNGWWRIAVTATTGITSGDLIAGYVGFSGGGFTAGDFLYAYQAQLEAGAFATSVIPTVASQVTRAADVASVNTLSPWFNSVAGTFYFEGDTAVPASLTLRNLTNINDGTLNNTNRLYLYNGNMGGSTAAGGVTQADVVGGAYTVNTVFKFAYGIAANNFAVVLNGGAPATDALGTLPSGLTTFEIASSLGGTVNTGHIRRITYYPRRLTNAELQTLTTL